MCEYCLFPARLKSDPPDFRRYDCLNECFRGLGCSFKCPVALDKKTLTPFGPPYDWKCPEQSHGELYPTCIVNKFGNLFGKHYYCNHFENMYIHKLDTNYLFRQTCQQHMELQSAFRNSECLIINCKHTVWNQVLIIFFV